MVIYLYIYFNLGNVKTSHLCGLLNGYEPGIVD